MSERLAFVPLAREHLELIHRWSNEGPVLKWYATRPLTLADIEGKYLPRIDGTVPTQGYLLLVDDEPAGYWQTYRIDDHPDYARAIDAEPDWSGMDFFIGEERFRGRGLAPRAHVVFCEEHAPTGIVVSGPHPENRASIRSLERAGFERLRTVDSELLMVRYR